jgi:hypothetical protein
MDLTDNAIPEDGTFRAQVSINPLQRPVKILFVENMNLLRIPPALLKRQRTGALPGASRLAPASWTAVALRRFPTNEYKFALHLQPAQRHFPVVPEPGIPWPHAPTHQLAERGTYFVTSSTYQKAHHFRGAKRLRVLHRGFGCG